MSSVELFEHNEIGYQKLNQVLIDNDSAVINHATGTGKSFIAIKFMHENRDKKVLYLAPTYFILRQLERDCKKLGISIEDLNVDRMIYRGLLGQDMEALYKKYDVIIFDEFHRLGAKDTYKQLKKLKLLQKQDATKKKFIGLSATPIRYLDRERNMTEELFDGVEASRLSLSEAMLESILPVPMYINSKISCAQEAERVERRIARMAPCEEKDKLQNKLEKVKQQVLGTVENFSEMLKKYIKEKDGKFIIFCSTILQAEQCYKVVDNWFSYLGKIKKYIVHSKQKYTTSEKERQLRLGKTGDLNQDNLNDFNNDKDGISVMICIDVLNEGVHVDNVDNIIFFRRTVSPRIYFQQLGRLLSFSGRRKNVRVFDLVDNIGNHRAIYDVYDEFIEEMKRIIEIHPEKKTEYEEILSRFKILDETKELFKELAAIKAEVTEEKIIESRIVHAINMITNFIKTNEIKGPFIPFLYKDKGLRSAYATICKYYKYITNKQFEKLLEIEIILPEKLAMTQEEREEMLQGFDSIYEKELLDEDRIVKDICDFFMQKGYMPKLNSGDNFEKSLAYKYLSLLPNLKEESKNKLREILLNLDIDLKPWEKVFLNIELESEDVELLIAMSNEVLNLGNSLPEYLYRAMDEIIIKYTLKESQEIFAILEMSDKIDFEKRKEREEERQRIILELENDLIDLIGADDEADKVQDLLAKAMTLKSNDKSFVMKKFRLFKRKYYEDSIHPEEQSEMIIFCRQMKTISLENISVYATKLQKDRQTYMILSRFAKFVIENQGRLPDINNQNPEEVIIAREYLELLSKGSIDKQFNKIVTDITSGVYDAKKLLLEIIEKRLEDCISKEVILKYVTFIRKKGRKALENSLNEDEIALANKFRDICENYLSEDENEALRRSVNAREILERTTKQYIRNTLKKKQDSYDEV